MSKNRLNSKEIQLTRIVEKHNAMNISKLKKLSDHPIKVEHNFKAGDHKDSLKIELIFRIKSEKGKQIMYLQLDFYFTIQHLTDYFGGDDQPVTPQLEPLMTAILGMAFSTARGIIYEKLRSMGIFNVILPVVAPKNMIQQKK